MKSLLAKTICLVVVAACAPGTDPVFHKRELAGGGEKGDFGILKSGLVYSDLGRGISADRLLLEDQCVRNDVATLGDLSFETVRIELHDPGRRVLAEKLGRLFPYSETWGNNRSEWVAAGGKLAIANQQQASSAVLRLRRGGRFLYGGKTEVLAKPECENYVVGMNVGAFLFAGLRVEYPNHGQREEFKKQFGANSPFSPGANPKMDSAMSQKLKEMGAKVGVVSFQFGGNTEAVDLLARLGSHCSVADLEACRKLVRDLEKNFVQATQDRAVRLSAVGGKSPWQVMGFVPLKALTAPAEVLIDIPEEE
ncbi:MAG: hypothetical protein KDD51_14300 [Bdellovibrionales bacterium]|nr:hypothetical protein [Bdellovibrionales bacterium]